MTKFLRRLFSIEHLCVSAITVLIVSLFYTIITRLEFLDPIGKVVEELQISDIYSQIHNTGTKEKNELITLVDIGDLWQRDEIADVVEEIAKQSPTILATDVIFEGRQSDTIVDNRLSSVFMNAIRDSLPIVLATKLTNYDEEQRCFSDATHSFFVQDLTKTLSVNEGCVNTMNKVGTRVKSYPVYLMQGEDTILSLPAMVAHLLGTEILMHDDNQLPIRFDGTSFSIVKYCDIEKEKDKIANHIVLLGAANEENDKHFTPIGEISGMEIIAHTIKTMVEKSGIYTGGLFWIVFVALLAGYLMNVVELFAKRFFTSWLPRRFGKKDFLWASFMVESEIYDKVLAFVFMVCFTFFTYTLYTNDVIYVNTWLALATVGFIEEGRLIYKAILSYMLKKGVHCPTRSVYANELIKKS